MSWTLGLEALAAEDGPALGRLEGHGRLNAALGALGASLGTGESCCRWTASGRKADTGALGLARLAALGVVLELFIEEEELLSGGEDELAATVCARQKSVYKFHGRFSHVAGGCQAKRSGFCSRNEAAERSTCLAAFVRTR
jgi:hypothetical protein